MRGRCCCSAELKGWAAAQPLMLIWRTEHTCASILRGVFDFVLNVQYTNVVRTAVACFDEELDLTSENAAG